MNTKGQCTECGAVNTEPVNVGAEHIHRCLECGEYFEDDEFMEEFLAPRQRKNREEDE